VAAHASGIRFDDPVAVARVLVPRLRREERADVIVALSHLGYLPDVQLARTVAGMDVILGAHSHTVLDKQVWENDTLIAQTGCYGRALGRVDLLVRPTGTNGQSGRGTQINGRDERWWGQNGVPAPRSLPVASAANLPASPLLSPAATADPAVLAAYAPHETRLRPHLDETLTTATEPLPATDAARRETALANLLADAVRAQAKTDIGLVAPGQMDANGLPAGPVRVRDLYALMGAYTRQHLVIARVTGPGFGNCWRRPPKTGTFACIRRRRPVGPHAAAGRERERPAAGRDAQPIPWPRPPIWCRSFCSTNPASRSCRTTWPRQRCGMPLLPICAATLRSRTEPTAGSSALTRAEARQVERGRAAVGADLKDAALGQLQGAEHAAVGRAVSMPILSGRRRTASKGVWP
jgi:hypothetical protein